MSVKRQVLPVRSIKHQQFIDITSSFEELIPPNFTGLANLFVMHTTGALMINENADPNVLHDLHCDMTRLTPWHNPDYLHAEGNSASHWRSACFGPSINLQIENGRWIHGIWQGLYFCEFDGPRNRQISVMFID